MRMREWNVVDIPEHVEATEQNNRVQAERSEPRVPPSAPAYKI